MSEHESPIKTPKQLVVAIMFGFLIPIIVIFLLVSYVGFGEITGAGTNSMSEENIKERIQPVAQINYKDPNTPIVYKTGKEVYETMCVTCHALGAVGAPKFGNNSDWTPRITQGFANLLHSLLNGKGAMPARAGSSPDDYSNYELSRAIVYMVNSSGGKLPEPQIPPQSKVIASNIQVKTEIQTSTPASTTPTISTTTKEKEPTETKSTPLNLEEGKKIFEQICITCHGSGVAGAPKFGDKVAWLPRIAIGKEALYQGAIKGKGAMPPKGGFTGSDEEFKSAVDYILSAVK
jgi:cytochrome c5